MENGDILECSIADDDNVGIFKVTIAHSTKHCMNLPVHHLIFFFFSKLHEHAKIFEENSFQNQSAASLVGVEMCFKYTDNQSTTK